MVGGRRPASFVKAAITISFVAVVGCALASCRQVAGIDDKSVADSCGATSERTPDCGECMAIDCCAELSACAADPACARAQTCLAQCEANDARCRSACAESARDGYDELLARVIACRTNACGAACSSACGEAAPASVECASCGASSCCAEERACNASVACLTRRWRREHCRESTCRNLSDDRNPSGAPEDSQLQVCLDRSCGLQCASWACVTTPKTDAPVGPVTVTIATLDSLFLSGVVGLRVRVCNRNDAECTNAVGNLEQITGPGGFTTFENIPVPSGRDSFDGYFEIIDPKAERIPTLVFVDPPVRGARTIPVPSFTYVARGTIEQALGVMPDPRTAFIGVRLIDCAGGEGSGVKMSLDGVHPEVVPFYLDHRLPTVGGSPKAMTDGELAFGGFVAVPPGATTVRGQWAANDVELFSVGIYVSSGKFSYVSFSARP